ncbi:MAG: histone deacetylase [Spirosomataceae bacterium]
MLKIAYHPIYKHPLPEGHRFPMLKYELIPEQLIHEGTVESAHFFTPVLQSDINRYILGVHDERYVKALQEVAIDPKMERKIGFPVTEKLIEREWLITQGTILCCQYALKYGISMNIAGGTHHAYPDRGEGFCLLNDVAVGAEFLLQNELSKQILVIDLDVHQGNGTAVIFQDRPEVFTFSMHGKDNYPLKKEISDLDIALPTGTEDEAYLRLLDFHLSSLLDTVNPDFLFFISGVDVLSTDKLGKLGMTMEGCQERDKRVIQAASERNIPLVVSMGGGYSPQIATIIEAHCQTFRLAADYAEWGFQKFKK